MTAPAVRADTLPDTVGIRDVATDEVRMMKVVWSPADLADLALRAIAAEFEWVQR